MRTHHIQQQFCIRRVRQLHCCTQVLSGKWDEGEFEDVAVPEWSPELLEARDDFRDARSAADGGRDDPVATFAALLQPRPSPSPVRACFRQPAMR